MHADEVGNWIGMFPYRGPWPGLFSRNIFFGGFDENAEET
jgi:hypothetical protein